MDGLPAFRLGVRAGVVGGFFAAALLPLGPLAGFLLANFILPRDELRVYRSIAQYGRTDTVGVGRLTVKFPDIAAALDDGTRETGSEK